MNRIFGTLLICVLLVQNLYSQSESSTGGVEEIIEASEPFIEKKSNGSINWTDQYIEAKGESVIDTARFKNPAQANAMASRGAVVVAQRNLLEIIEGVHVQGETTVRDMITESDVIQTKVDGILKNAQIVEGPKMNDFGLMEVTMRVPIYSNTGLASAVYQKKPQEALASGFETEKVGKKEVSSKKSKKEIRSIQDERTELEAIEDIIFQVTEGQFTPSVFPRIADAEGNTLMDLMDAYNINQDNLPKILKNNPKLIEKLKSNPKSTLVELVQDEGGNLIAKGNGKEVLEKIKNTGLDILKIAKSVILF